MLFAVSDVVWQALIAAVVTLTLAYFNRRTGQKVEQKVIEVKDTLAAVDDKHVQKLDKVVEEVSSVKAAVAEVHDATNGLQNKLVQEVRKASFAAGVKSEKDKHE